MEMELSPGQTLLQQSARDLLAQKLPLSLVKQLQNLDANGHSADLWRQLAENGWLGLAISEAYGGGGGTLTDLGIFYEEAGRALTPTTLYSTMFAALIISALGTEAQKRRYLSRIAQGSMIGTVAYAEPTALHNPACFTTTAKRDGDGWMLFGAKSFVPNAHLSDLMVVVARRQDSKASEGLILLAVSPNAPGLSVEPQQTIGIDRQSLVRFEGVRLGADAVLGGSPSASETAAALDLAISQATALQSVEMAGGAQKVLEVTVSYVSERQQFGVPIGSFQAVQHHLANMATAIDGARLVAYQALSLLSGGLPAQREVAIAKAVSGETYKSVTVLAHQLWAGVGYSTESDLYLWSNRAKATELSFGTRDLHLKRLADLLAAASAS